MRIDPQSKVLNYFQSNKSNHHHSCECVTYMCITKSSSEYKCVNKIPANSRDRSVWMRMDLQSRVLNYFYGNKSHLHHSRECVTHVCITNLVVNTSASNTFTNPSWQCAERRASVAAEAAVEVTGERVKGDWWWSRADTGRQQECPPRRPVHTSA